MAEWKRLAAELPGLPISWKGGLCWDQPRAGLEAHAATHSSWGYGVRETNREEAARIEPNLAEPPDFALFVAEEGAAEPEAVARMLIAAAQRRGVRLLAGADYGGADPGSDPGATARALFDAMKSMLKDADALEYDSYTLGFRPTPLDGFPVLGRPKDIGNLYVAVTHSGVTLAPAVGLFTAREILEGVRDPLLRPYGADRFG
jgi:glycine/D-amino acid oxidase-like deaminating enzyme